MARCLTVVNVVLLFSACAGDSARELNASAKGDAGASQRKCFGANDCEPGYECNELGYCSFLRNRTDGGSDSNLPVEVENKSEVPASGKRFVYVAVPGQDMVAKIDSETLQVHAIKVGKNPGALKTVPGEDVAVVLNRSSESVTVLRTKADGGDEIITLPTVIGLNQLALAPDGKHAIAYFDVASVNGSSLPTQALQEVNLLALEAGHEESIPLPVGFRPSGVQFSSDGSRAFILTEQGISVVEFAKVTKSSIVPTVPLLKDVLKEPKPAEVQVTPDGKRALLRQNGVQGIRAVDLLTKAFTDIPLPSEATDLDLTENGALALVVLREAGKVAFVDIPGDLEDPSHIEMLSTQGYTVGQVTLTPDSKRAFLFSNATAQEILLVADLQSRTIELFPLKKGVRAVQSSPEGNAAVIIHNKVPGTPSPEEGMEGILDKSWGYSLLSLDTGFVKLRITDADPGQLVFAPDSSSGYLLLSDSSKGVRSVEAIDLSSFLVKSISLGSPPVAVGVVAETQKIYAAQNHPLGRVTFIDRTTYQTKTVTGFELNSDIVE